MPSSKPEKSASELASIADEPTVVPTVFDCEPTIPVR
jgi:hypothetical protein